MCSTEDAILAGGPETGEPPQLYRVEPGVHYLPHFTPDGNRIIFAFDNPCHPDDLWSLSLARWEHLRT